MFSNVKRDDKYLQYLHNFIWKEYQINAESFITAARGYYGETWQIKTADNKYFVKLDYSPHKEIYERSFRVIEHLRSYGIDSVSRIIPNITGELSTRFDSAVLGIFDWIDGENIQNETTKIAEYKLLGKIYTVPTGNVAIPRDNFSTESADLFYKQWCTLKHSSGCKNLLSVLSVLKQYSSRLKERAERLALFAGKCKSDKSHFYITHGDAGGNVIVNKDKFYIIDWDDTLLAPPERDAWFCLHWEWAMTAFNDALKENGINYTLRSERLAYYCYDMFFFYMNAYMETYFILDNTDMAEKFTEYFNCWIEEEIRYADKL